MPIVVSSGHSTPINLKVASRYLFLSAFGLLIGAGVWGGLNNNAIQTGTQTQGTVVDILSQGKGYTPLIEFTAADGEAVQFHPYSSQSPSAYAIGDSVTVYYDPADPETARLDSFLSLWFGPMMLGIAGGVDLILALIFFILPQRKTL